jgi:hypothetical protein
MKEQPDRRPFLVMSERAQARFRARADRVGKSRWTQGPFISAEVLARARELHEAAQGEMDKVSRGGGVRAMKRTLQRRRDAAMLRAFGRLLEQREVDEFVAAQAGEQEPR